MVKEGMMTRDGKERERIVEDFTENLGREKTG